MRWNLKPKPSKEFIEKFPEYPLIVVQLLFNRGLDSQDKIDEFFSPDWPEDLHDPFLMLGMKKAVERIIEAIRTQEAIAVFGDYDADGVCGTAILEITLKALGANFHSVYIPDRAKEGYSLNLKAIKNLAQQGIKLLITVDCGIRNIKEVKLAKSLGMEVVITDHHEVGQGLPEAEAIVNPWQ